MNVMRSNSLDGRKGWDLYYDVTMHGHHLFHISLHLSWMLKITVAFVIDLLLIACPCLRNKMLQEKGVIPHFTFWHPFFNFPICGNIIKVINKRMTLVIRYTVGIANLTLWIEQFWLEKTKTDDNASCIASTKWCWLIILSINVLRLWFTAGQIVEKMWIK